VELWVELLPHLLGEAEPAQLGEDLLEEVDLWLLELALSQLEEEWLGLAEIFAGSLAQQDGEELADSSLVLLVVSLDVLEEVLRERILHLHFELLQGFDALRLLDDGAHEDGVEDGLAGEWLLSFDYQRENCGQDDFRQELALLFRHVHI